MARAKILDPFKATIINVLVKQVMVALVAKLPFLSFGPLGYVASFFLSKLIGFILENTILGINLGIIEVTVNAEVIGLNKLLEKAKNLPEDKKDELPKIEEEIINAVRDLISIRDKYRL